MTEQRGRTKPRTWAVLAAALAVVAVVALVIAVTGQQSPPQPARADAGATTSPSAPPATPSSVPDPAAPSSDAPAATSESPAAEPVAKPVSVSIPAIDVTSDLMRLGLQEDGTVEVPPLEEDDQAGWYERGPAPGALGPAVLLGHVDSSEWGPGIFFELGALRAGDEVEVARADGSVAVFAVDRVERYAKADFPTIEVYGNTEAPELRLITCGGDFDPGEGSYEDNVVAYASLVDVRSA